MSFDGVFIRHLLEEIKINLIHQRINRVHNLDKNSFILSLSNRYQLLIDLHADSSHLRYTNIEFIPANQTFPLFTLMKKNLEGGRILGLEQVENDRIIILKIASFNNLGFPKEIKLVLELFGRNSNLILLDEEGMIIECLKKTYLLNDKGGRIILPKVKYVLPEDRDRINPYTTDKVLEYNRYQGVSNLLYPEIRFQNNLEIINQKTEPVIIKANEKYYFYCFNLEYLNGEIINYPTLSELLEHYYVNIKHQDIINSEQKQLEMRFRKEKIKSEEKLKKQKEEFQKAKKNLNLEKLGNLLSANLHLVPKGASAIEVEDFYNDGQKVLINLNPLLSPVQNLEQIYRKYKKAKRTLNHLEEQIKNSYSEILYWETMFKMPRPKILGKYWTR
jgi:predicted ribosome quality control (RQC) complex YloA/Tae2 family protein